MRKTAWTTLMSLLILLATASVQAEDTSTDEGDFKYPTALDYPKVRKTGVKPNDFVPKGWKIIGQATGDLNGDKAQDTALVLQSTDKKFKQANHALGEAIFDTNGRMLIVLFKDSAKGGFNLAEQANTIIPIPDSPTMGEPFTKVEIKSGVLNLGFAVWYSAGTWFSSDSLYKFKYLNDRFVLIGAEVNEFQRNSGQSTQLSYNFYTHKLKSVITGGAREGTEENSGNGESSDKPKVKWLTLPNKPPRPMSSFKKLNEWKVVGEYTL
ncbi:MAG: hypothetical protein WCT03_13505 [Candidatus Obscuribacterales bacterium]|jgi:hypothetical protein